MKCRHCVLFDDREDIINSAVSNSTEFAEEMANTTIDDDEIMSSLISEIKETHEKERQNAIAHTAKSEKTNKALIEGQTKMAAEIQALKSTVEKLENENKCIKMVLDIKQDEWLKVQTKKDSSLKRNERKSTISVQNSFAGLEIEDSQYTSFPEIVEIDEETKKPSRKNKGNPSKHNANHPKVSKTPGNATTKPQDPAKPHEKMTLVIGDSMVKNIISKKIERAAGHKSVCHSYSGARVKQIEEKLKNDGDGHYDSVILHVGTNDLAHADAYKVAKDMDDLINEVKTHTKKIAVSNVIQRYDR